LNLKEQVKSELHNDSRTLEKRNEVKRKLKEMGETELSAEQIVCSLERFCLIVINANSHDG